MDSVPFVTAVTVAPCKVSVTVGVSVPLLPPIHAPSIAPAGTLVTVHVKTPATDAALQGVPHTICS